MSGTSGVHDSPPAGSAKLARLATIGLAVALLAAAAQIGAGPGRQLGLWDHNFGFKILEWGGYGGLAAAGACLIGLVFAWVSGQRRLAVIGLIGLVLGALLAYWPWALQKDFRAPPPLYDITTDTADPPRFVAALGLRQGTARLPVDYPANFAAQQQQAYPDIKPVELKQPPAAAFDRAVRAARDMGWKVHTTAAADGRIEAVAKTLWFGFEDDVVIRVTAVDGGSRIDIRSTGRIGRRDGGANAKRVQAYIKTLNAAG